MVGKYDHILLANHFLLISYAVMHGFGAIMQGCMQGIRVDPNRASAHFTRAQGSRVRHARRQNMKAARPAADSPLASWAAPAPAGPSAPAPPAARPGPGSGVGVWGADLDPGGPNRGWDSARREPVYRITWTHRYPEVPLLNFFLMA